MASSARHRQRNSMDEPPGTLSDVIRLKEEFNALCERRYHELQENMQALSQLTNAFEKAFILCYVVGIVGGVATIAGLALAPFTLGVSAVVAGVGSVMALGGGVGSGVLFFKKIHILIKFIQNFKNILEPIQNRIPPMTDSLKVICEHINEILRKLNKPEDDISGLIKCAASASEILFDLQIDVGEVAAQASKSVRLTTTLREVLASISLVLNILSVIKDNKTLNEMEKFAGNRQISESEMKSEAEKFVVEMRKVINQLQNTLDELKKTKNKLARELDLILTK